jgi:ubiquinone/menaquinone biosynthesis C-methylase UbiE
MEASNSNERRSHWEKVYRERSPDEVSWYQANPARSLELIAQAGLDLDTRILDVGGGASVLVDHLLDLGYQNLTVLDIAEKGLAAARDRLGARAADVRWVAGDVTEMRLEGPHDLWHDRAVFHFLVEAD